MLNTEDICATCESIEECKKEGINFSVPLINSYEEPILSVLRAFKLEDLGEDELVRERN